MNEFDKWRSEYETLSLEDQVKYHNDLERRYPEQNHYNYEWAKAALSLVPYPIVLEFGTWKGDLAKEAFRDFVIQDWYGIEICQAAIEKTKCERVKYITPKRFDWFAEQRTLKPDIIIATHFIEHLSNDHFDQLAEYCRGVKVVHFESPLTNEGNDWRGYEGTHKLLYGWDDVVNVMWMNGYELKYDHGDAKTFVYAG